MVSNNKENKKPTKSIKLLEPNEDYKKFLTKKPAKPSAVLKSKNFDRSNKENTNDMCKKVTVEPAYRKETHNAVTKKQTEKARQTTLEKSKKETVKKDAKDKAKSTDYVSSNESYKMSTTYEFSGNSRDESGNLSDDSLVKIFKSKLPTSVKINRILTPHLNNVKVRRRYFFQALINLDILF